VEDHGSRERGKLEEDGVSQEATDQVRGTQPLFFNRYKTKYLWLLFFLWILYGQLIAYCIAEKYIYDMVFLAWDSALRYVPAIMRLKDVYLFGVDLARLHATAMLMSTPVLFILMLAANVEDSIHGVRAKKKESLLIFVLIIVVCLALISGFGAAGPSKLFQSSYAGFSVLTALITYLLAYMLRAIYCLISNK
jgi:hypothetical protein